MAAIRKTLGIALGAILASTLATVEQSVAEDTRPVAIVSLGDNGIAGEGAGAYEEGTNGENGNWCHRSLLALVHRTRLGGRGINIACSGAKSINVSLADSTHYTEGSQSQRLIEIAKKYKVTTVIVRVGSNDDPNFGGTVVACIRAYLYPNEPGCAEQLRPVWGQRLAAMKPKVEKAIADVQSAMSQAGYANSDYTFVLTSYASPITEKMGPQQQETGCPFRLSDAKWGRTEAVPQLNKAIRDIAKVRAVRYLDLTRATEGREACSRPSAPATEWQTRITVDPWKLVHGQLDPIEQHRAAESFHINARGHSQLGGCLTEFVQSGKPAATCLEGTDGNLHPTPI